MQSHLLLTPNEKNLNSPFRINSYRLALKVVKFKRLHTNGCTDPLSLLDREGGE